MSLTHITNSSFYQPVDRATSVPQARWPLYINKDNVKPGMRACLAYPNWLMSTCCEQGPGKRNHQGTIERDDGWDVCVSTKSDIDFQVCFATVYKKGNQEDGDGADDSGNWGEDADNGHDDYDSGEGSGDNGSWKPNGNGEGGHDDGSWKPDGNGDGHDDGMWHGKRFTPRPNLVRRKPNKFQLSCVKPSSAAPKFAQRMVLGSSVFAAVVAVLATGL
ncbi:hypothetical protein CspeluHIS016_0114040 [Cutaneotrichosporon spelunceum]|uniref:Uncharacterized protein n=1 Tax=Cutaneotrichosporon spelunceum TaxID=1672016 RepID=A0AAD3YA97_9TREE|nr:hypothetical protein CspeluHIS016_0114040 [Cutaneotrichosporon spelunceum]